MLLVGIITGLKGNLGEMIMNEKCVICRKRDAEHELKLFSCSESIETLVCTKCFSFVKDVVSEKDPGVRAGLLCFLKLLLEKRLGIDLS